MVERRTVLKAAGAAGALTVFGVGYGSTLKGIGKGWWATDPPRDRLAGNAPVPEFTVDRATGAVTVNPHQIVANTVCMGCNTICGVRVRVDRASGRVLRVAGNPYHPLSTDPHLPEDTPIVEAYRRLAGAGDGPRVRSTACARGNAVLDKLTDPYRLLTPLKRVGARGEGRWEPITFEQLVEEVVEGGDLFGEGHVEGLRAIRDLETPIDPDAPELGPRANRMALITGFDEGRRKLAIRWAKTLFGTQNFTGQGGNCGVSMRAGYAALLGDWGGYPHLKPDFRNTEFLLAVGIAPGNAGNPFKRQGQLIAEQRAAGTMTMVVVDPVLTNADSMAAGERVRWLPVNPGADGALAMGMIRWILDHERYNATFLSQPNAATAKAAGEPSWSNATHLVVVDEDDEQAGAFLRAARLGLSDDPDELVVIDAASGRPVAQSTATGPADPLHRGTVTVDGHEVAVATSLAVLADEARRRTIDEYAEACGIPAAGIERLADEFTSHGRRAAADCHGGTMNTNGFYTAYAVLLLNALVGNLNWKGGTSAGGGRFAEVGEGPRYDLASYPGKVKPTGVSIGRNGDRYEDSSEYQRKVDAGQNPYPATAPWYPLGKGLQPEFMTSMLNGYPYSLEAVIFWNTNPMYGQAGLHDQVRDAIVDPKRLPLIVSIDAFLNETSAYADYVLPDTILYESWGAAGPWGGVPTRTNSVRWPVLDSPAATTATGEPVGLEAFLIAVAEKLDLPGFGDDAIPDADGNLHPFKTREDWFARVLANMAFDEGPVPDADPDELAVTGADRVLDRLREVLTDEEWPKVARVITRGGRFEAYDGAYEDDWLAHRYEGPMHLYDEDLGTSRNSMSGARFVGTGTWLPPVLADGSPVDDRYPREQWPLRAVSTKSQYMGSRTVGTSRIHDVQPQPGIVLHRDDAAALGIHTGDRIRVVSPGGAVEGLASVRAGVQRGVVGLEHGYGHWQQGAAATSIGNERWHASVARGLGAAHNRLGFADPTRDGFSTLADVVVGSNARQGLPVRVERMV